MSTTDTNIKKVSDALIDALTLPWTDNGNIMADAVRDACIDVLSNVLSVDTQTVRRLVDERVSANQ